LSFYHNFKPVSDDGSLKKRKLVARFVQ